jgi:hypothetical protein
MVGRFGRTKTLQGGIVTKLLSCLGLFVVLGLAPAAHARNFFKRAANVGITYSNIFTGTVTLVTHAAYEIRYSDDDAICLIIVNGKQLDCKSDRSSSTSVYLDLKGGAMDNFLNSILSSAGHSNYGPLVTRILSNEIYTQHQYPFRFNYSQSGGVKQIHDPQPESFHVLFEKFGPEVQLRDDREGRNT